MNINDFSEIYVFCFDLFQYHHDSDYLVVNVFAKYEGKTYISPDIKLSTSSCKWKNGKWNLPSHLSPIGTDGLIKIIDGIVKGNAEIL